MRKLVIAGLLLGMGLAAFGTMLAQPPTQPAQTQQQPAAQPPDQGTPPVAQTPAPKPPR